MQNCKIIYQCAAVTHIMIYHCWRRHYVIIKLNLFIGLAQKETTKSPRSNKNSIHDDNSRRVKFKFLTIHQSG